MSLINPKELTRVRNSGDEFVGSGFERRWRRPGKGEPLGRGE
ncbi:hypothetical protein [Affinibrenneria salicis]|nr:hypothetical protein [Affinibrenneria salicis]